MLPTRKRAQKTWLRSIDGGHANGFSPEASLYETYAETTGTARINSTDSSAAKNRRAPERPGAGPTPMYRTIVWVIPAFFRGPPPGTDARAVHAGGRGGAGTGAAAT